MALKIKRLNQHAIIPTKAYATDLGYDLYANESLTLHPGFSQTISTGICIGFPEGWGGFIKDRSSMASRRYNVTGGVIDNAYVGEIKIILTNNNHIGKLDIKIGDKIAQIVPIPVTNFDIVEVSELNETDRGDNGFGSSGS